MNKTEMLNKLGELSEENLQGIIEKVFNKQNTKFSDFVKPIISYEEDLEIKYNQPINENTKMLMENLVKQNKEYFCVNENEKLCDVIIDFEEKRTCFIFIENGVVRNRSCPVGNYTIACQIAKEFQLYNEDKLNTQHGGELRDKHGFVAMGGNYADATSEVSAKISKIIRNVMTRIHTELVRSINAYRSNLGGNRPSQYYLTGSIATMHNMQEFWMDRVGLSQVGTVLFLDPKDEKKYKEYYEKHPKVTPDQIVVIEKSQRPPNEQKYTLPPEVPSIGGYGVMDSDYLSASACREKALDFMVDRKFDQAIDYFCKAIERYGNFDENIDNYITECLVGKYEDAIKEWKEEFNKTTYSKEVIDTQIENLEEQIKNTIKERQEHIDERYGRTRRKN